MSLTGRTFITIFVCLDMKFDQEIYRKALNAHSDSLLFADVLFLLQPIQIEEVDPVFQIGGLRVRFLPKTFVAAIPQNITANMI